ncbi:hypothetical protein [Sphingopyxis sp. 2PD]|uniref:hypothetical protein n=1 Tax=Sphingopyxis sp. 2PD TaxID=2502196 RepID=UPI0010F866D5|nr:hypothetical protein [Sphingopyxis sp. 2PD]
MIAELDIVDGGVASTNWIPVHFDADGIGHGVWRVKGSSPLATGPSVGNILERIARLSSALGSSVRFAIAQPWRERATSVRISPNLS